MPSHPETIREEAANVLLAQLLRDHGLTARGDLPRTARKLLDDGEILVSGGGGQKAKVTKSPSANSMPWVRLAPISEGSLTASREPDLSLPTLWSKVTTPISEGQWSRHQTPTWRLSQSPVAVKGQAPVNAFGNQLLSYWSPKDFA